RHEPDPVRHGDLVDGPPPLRLGGEASHLGHRHAIVRLVLEADDAPAGVAVARRAEEDDERAGRGVAHGAHQAVEHDRRAHDAKHRLGAPADGREERHLVTAGEPGSETRILPRATPATARDSMAAAPTCWYEIMRKSSPKPSRRFSRRPVIAS